MLKTTKKIHLNFQQIFTVISVVNHFSFAYLSGRRMCGYFSVDDCTVTSGSWTMLFILLENCVLLLELVTAVFSERCKETFYTFIFLYV